MDSRILFILNLIYVIIWQNFHPKWLNIVEIKMSTNRHQFSAVPIQVRIEVHYRFICSVLPTTMLNFHPAVLTLYTYQLCIFSNIVLVMMFVTLVRLHITPSTKYTNIIPYPYQQPRNRPVSQTTRAAICFEHKTQYLLIRAPYTRIVLFWHISNIPPWFHRVKLVVIPPSFI